MKINKSIANIKIIQSIVLIVAILFLILSAPIKIAYAAYIGSYTDVLNDLHRDTTFDESYYPEIKDDYSLDIIQIAESENDELLVYVYQPSGQSKDLRASSINISRSSHFEINPGNYSLQYINSSGVFYKYLVKGLTVTKAATRYYGVTSIYRKFDKTIDNEADYGQSITEVPFNISREYRFSTINGQPACAVLDIETIEIKPEDKFVGFVRYQDGFKFWGDGACDSHFVAFSTDKPIDKLYEAKVAWVQQSYTEFFGVGAGDPVYGTSVSKDRELSIEDDTVHYKGGGINAGSYEWERIQSVDDFKASVDMTQNVYSGALININVASKITEEGKKAFEGKQWVLRFAETDYDYNSSGAGWGTATSTLVGDVTILRLKFETDGITYNLGVIDNKQTGSKDTINTTETIVEMSDLLKQVLGIIGIILIIVIVVALAVVVKPIGEVLKFIFKCVWAVISAPFKFIVWLFGGKKK